MSGTISLSMLRSHLQNTGTTAFGLSGAGMPKWNSSPGPYVGSGEYPQYVPKNRSSSLFPNDNSPFAISEWRGYSHSQHGTCSATSFTTRGIGKDFTYYKIKLTGADGYTSSVTVQCNEAPSTNIRCNFYTAYPFSNVGALTTSASVLALSFDLDADETIKKVFTMSSASDVFFHVVAWQYTV